MIIFAIGKLNIKCITSRGKLIKLWILGGVGGTVPINACGRGWGNSAQFPVIAIKSFC